MMSAPEMSQFSMQVNSTTRSDNNTKYGGMIKRSKFRILRKNLQQLVNYVYTESPRFALVHIIITFFRIVQFVFPSLVPTNAKYNNNEVLKNTVSVFSVFCYILPSSQRGESAIYFLIAYDILSLGFIILTVGCAYYFQQSAQLPTLVSHAIVLFFATANFVLHPIAINFSLEIWSKLIFTGIPDMNIVAAILLPILTIAILGCYIWVFVFIITQTLYFRPMSLLTVTTMPQNFAFVFTIIINAIFGLAAYAPPIGQTVLYLINMIIYLGCSTIPYVRGGFINKYLSSVYSGSAFTGAAMSLVLGIFMLTDADLSTWLIIIFFVFFVVFSVISKIVMNGNMRRRIYLLEIFDEEKDVTIFKRRNTLINAVIDGMTVSHPAAVSGDIFKCAVDLWPQDTLIWFVYAKFTAIYPEQNVTLEWIYQTIAKSKIKGTDARAIKEQSLSIARQRESNLNSKLKERLNGMTKSMTSTKAKLRHVWDVIIQGSIGEMEGSIKKFFKDVEHNEADFKHLFRTYPNNRFVARNYARFCRELLADTVGYIDYTEMSKQMQRGVMVNEDQAHVLGMHAFKNLPVRLHKIKESSVVSADMSVSDTGALFDTDEWVVQEMSQATAIRETIDHLDIPSIKNTKIMRSLMIFIFFIVLVIAVLIYIPIYILDTIAILQYMNYMGGCRNNNYQISITTFHFIYEKLGVYNPTINQPLHPPKTLGSSYDTLTQIQYLIGKAVHNYMNLQTFSSYETTNRFILEAQRLLFEKVVNYTYFTNAVEFVTHNLTILTAFMDIADQAQTAIDKTSFEPSDVNTSMVMNLMNNVENIGGTFNDAFQEIVDGIIYDYNMMKKITLIVLIVGAVAYIIIFISALIFQLRNIQRDKMEVYRAMISLPKNHISLLVENLRNLKTDGNGESASTETDLNKQEDNIMKIFLNGGEQSTVKIADRVMLIIGSCITIIIGIVSLYIVTEMLEYMSERMMISAPHLDWEIATFNQFQFAQFLLQILSMLDTDNPLKPVIYTKEFIETRFNDAVVKGRDYYHKDRFGASNGDGRPFTGYQAGLDLADKGLNCTDPTHVPTDFFDMIYCFNAEGVYILFNSIMTRVYEKRNNGTYVMGPKDYYLDILYTLLMYPIYDGFICNMFGTIIPAIKLELNTKWAQEYPLLVMLLVFSVLFEVLAFIQLRFVEKHIKQALKLLLHLPGMVVTSSARVMKVLNGNFKVEKGDTSKRNAEFYDHVFANLPDAIILADPNSRVIEASNTAVERYFGKKTDDLKGQLLGDFLFDIDASEFHFGKNSKIIKVNDMDLEFSSQLIGGKQVLYMRDFTAITRYNKLIRDERSKSDALLTTILPPILVDRVIGGEKNISFAVQSATILFMDIVSFTPWCGSLPADKVMSTLNLMYQYFDEAASKYGQITKIKCIGDCYMCAGGIFGEINQPSEHAKEVVSFGLDALDAMNRLNKELNESLQIRVGINTGGPIVAGVLGIGKPTFEILGPAINMAQQMEHHGIPSQVHISRSVYELIYGDMFIIKERGNIEVKNGKVVTYLVNGRKNC